MERFGEGVDEVDVVYQTRSRFDPTFNERVAEALANDLERERAQETEIEDVDAFAEDDDEDEDYLPNENDASDVELEQELELQMEYDSDVEEVEVQAIGEVQAAVEIQPTVEIQPALQEAISVVNTLNFFGKDGTKWSKTPPPAGRTRIHNLMRFTGGPVQNNLVPVQVFKKLFTPIIVFIIIKETNRYGSSVVNQWNTNNPGKMKKVWKDLTEVELNAFIGTVLAAGASHNNMQDATFLWKTMSLPIFRGTMSYRRFVSLSRFIRFDDNRTRAFHAQSDKAAPIRAI